MRFGVKLSLRNRAKAADPKPPKDEQPSQLFARLTQRGKPSEVVEFKPTPTESYPIRIQLLSMGEQEACKVAALQKCREKGIPVDGDLSSNELYQDAVALEVLRMSVRETELTDTGFYRPAFASADQIRANLTPDEVVQLFNLYTLTQARFGMSDQAIMVKENFEAWVRAIAEGADYFPLARLPLPILVEVISGMAKELVNIWDSPALNLLNTSESIPQKLDTENSLSIEAASDGSQITKAQAFKMVQKELQTKPIEQPPADPISKDEALEQAKKLKNKR